MTTAVQEPSRAARLSIDQRWRLPIGIAISLVIAYILMVVGSCSTTGTGPCSKLDQGQAQFINALTIGGVYALIALGYTRAYGTLELLNFAHGEIFMVGSFVCWWLLTTLGFSGAITDPLVLIPVLILTFVVSMGVMGVVGVVIERLPERAGRRGRRRG